MKTVFLDIDTQIDFMFPTGALYVPGAEKILSVVAELNRKSPLVISTMCAHAEDDPEFKQYGPHCVIGTVGQLKPWATLLNDSNRQILFPKTQLDVFETPDFQPLLERLGAERFVIYGVVTEICVRCAAAGLLVAGKRVEIVESAVRSLDQSKGDNVLRDFAGSGVKIVSASEVVA
jgi:nicotinamidase/pyrazinamidase